MIKETRRRFLDFGQNECAGSSSSYEFLSRHVAEDDALLKVASGADPSQPIPNLFFAAVRYLLLSNGHGSTPISTNLEFGDRDAFRHFRSFVLKNSEAVISIMKLRKVQTNEVRRCTYLFPAFLYAARLFEKRPLALIEIGTSAGLNLLWDKYRYRFNGEQMFGASNSGLTLDGMFTERRPDGLGDEIPDVSHRIGLDLNIIDVSDDEDLNWLRSLIWPEHTERMKDFEAALKIRKQFELDLRTGDGFRMVEEIVRSIPAESIICIYHTHVANQISAPERASFLKAVDRIGRRRDLIHVFNNIRPNLWLSAYRNGEQIESELAEIDPHGKWIRWHCLMSRMEETRK